MKGYNVTWTTCREHVACQVETGNGKLVHHQADPQLSSPVALEAKLLRLLDEVIVEPETEPEAKPGWIHRMRVKGWFSDGSPADTKPLPVASESRVRTKPTGSRYPLVRWLRRKRRQGWFADGPKVKR